MKRMVQEFDNELFLECCKEIDIKAVPARSQNYIVLTDENGKESILNSKTNIFEEYMLEQVIETTYIVKNMLNKTIQVSNIIKELSDTCIYNNQGVQIYEKQKNIYKSQNIYAA